jgi:hypothetical protein
VYNCVFHIGLCQCIPWDDCDCERPNHLFRGRIWPSGIIKHCDGENPRCEVFPMSRGNNDKSTLLVQVPRWLQSWWSEEFIYIYIYALGYGLDERGSRVRFPAGAGKFLFTTASITALGPIQPPIEWVPGALSLGIKRPGREADHSHSSSAEVKECVELYLHSPIRLHGVVLS